jgi:hypothetical protein
MNEITTEEEALAAVRKRGRALKFVPPNLRTVEMCLEAVKEDGEALAYVPWGQFNLTIPEMAGICLEAMEHDKHDRQTFQYVPEKLRIAVHYYLNGGD